MFPQTLSLLNLVRCSTSLMTLKRWSRWSSKDEAQQWDTYPEPTELRLIGYLTESTWTPKSKSIMLTPKTNSKIFWQTQFHVMSGTIFSICSISFFQRGKLPRSDVEKNATRNKRRENCGKVGADVERGLAFCGKLSYSAELQCIKSSGDTQSTQSTWFESHSKRCRETCRWRFKSDWRRVGFSSVAKRCKNERKCEETRCCRHEPGSEFTRKCKETCRWKFRYQRRGRLEVTAQHPYISCQRSTLPESLLVFTTATQAQARRQNGGSRSEGVDMLNVHDCHPTSRSSSWKRLFGEFTFNQKISHDEQWNNCSMWQRSWSRIRKKSKNFRDRLATQILEKDSVDRPSSSIVNSESLCMYSPIQYCAWEESDKVP